jgi:hypothetical protein
MQPVVVIASSRRVGRFVLALLVVALLAAVTGIVQPQFIYRCPCGSYQFWGMSFCTPCWASVVQGGSPAACAPPARGVMVRR